MKLLRGTNLGIAYYLVLSFLLLKPQSNVDLFPAIFGIPADKIIHLLLFIPSYSAVDLTLKRGHNYLLALLLCILAESIHYLLPYRSFSWYDMLANVLGMHLGALMYGLLPSQVKKRLKGDTA